MDEFEKNKRNLMQPVLFEAGAALLDCQSFEYILSVLLLHLSARGFKGLKTNEMLLILENKDKKTAGQLIAMIKKLAPAAPAIEKALGVALAARNELIHRVLVDNIEKLHNQSGRKELFDRIQELRGEVLKAKGMLEVYVDRFDKELGYDSPQEMEKLRRSFS